MTGLYFRVYIKTKGEKSYTLQAAFRTPLAASDYYQYSKRLSGVEGAKLRDFTPKTGNGKILKRHEFKDL